MSADSASLYEPLKAIREREKKRNVRQKIYKNGQRKETNTESGARRRIFGDGLCSMGSAQVNCQMHCVDGMHRR